MICIVSGLLWYQEPTGRYEPVFALSGLTFLITEACRRYASPKAVQAEDAHVRIDIDRNNVFVARYVHEGSGDNGLFGIGFYGLNIINESTKTITIKDFLFRFTLDSETHTELSRSLVTGSIRTPQDGQENRAIIIESKIDQYILIGWNNIRSRISELMPLGPGAVLSGSAYFVLRCADMAKLSSLQSTSFVVSDHAGRISVHPVQLHESWLRDAENRQIRPREFTTDSKGGVIDGFQ